TIGAGAAAIGTGAEAGAEERCCTTTAPKAAAAPATTAMPATKALRITKPPPVLGRACVNTLNHDVGFRDSTGQMVRKSMKHRRLVSKFDIELNFQEVIEYLDGAVDGFPGRRCTQIERQSRAGRKAC